MCGHFDTGIVPGFGLAVDFFFILSGFVLAKRYMDVDFCPTQFTIDRISRIFPLYIVAFAFRVITDGGSIFRILSSLSLIYMVGFDQGLGVLPVAWSISTEFWVNVTLLMVFLYLFTKQSYRPILISVLTITVLISYSVIFTNPNFEHWHMQKIGIIHAGLLRCIAGIGLGCLTYCVSRNVQIPVNKVVLNLIFLIFIPLFIAPLLLDKLSVSKSFIFLSPIFVLLLMNKDIIINSINPKYFLHIHKLSYPIYLFHKVIEGILEKMFGLPQKHFAMILTILISFPLAIWLEPFLIKKTRNLLNSWRVKEA
jgi:peptidoglycan/LPS O-acetylase OafA/YrhL